MDARRPTVLVVDDDVELGELLACVLEDAGYRVMVTPDVATLERFLAERRPAAAIVDLMLPEDAGFFACRRIREVAGPGVALLLISPGLEVAAGPAVAALGADEVVNVPFAIEEIIFAVARLCRPP
jgi:DNA-binding response OmpR family regulator